MESTDLATGRRDGLVAGLSLASLAWLAGYLALPALSERAAYGLLGLDRATRLGASVGFLLHDVSSPASRPARRLTATSRETSLPVC